jgi:hypothetical protein
MSRCAPMTLKRLESINLDHSSQGLKRCSVLRPDDGANFMGIRQ